MLQELHILNYSIDIYSLLFAMGILFSFFMIIFFKKDIKVELIDRVTCFSFWLFFFFIGAKIFYILENIHLYINKYYYIWGNGFSFTGGIIGGLLGIYVYSKRYKIEYKDLLNIFIIVFPITYMFGKFGCFFIGCCNAIYDIPNQLIEAIFNFIVVIYILSKNRNKLIVFKYLELYSCTRFIIDFIREKRGLVFMNISVVQIVCIIMFVLVQWFAKMDGSYLENSKLWKKNKI